MPIMSASLLCDLRDEGFRFARLTDLRHPQQSKQLLGEGFGNSPA